MDRERRSAEIGATRTWGVYAASSVLPSPVTTPARLPFRSAQGACHKKVARSKRGGDRLLYSHQSPISEEATDDPTRYCSPVCVVPVRCLRRRSDDRDWRHTP